MIDVENLSKSYQETKALNSINLSIGDSQVVGVLGPNGAGKSTLLEILTGQINRDTGDVKVLDFDPNKDGIELREEIGVLPEREDPPSFLTGSEFLDFVSEIRGKDINKDEWVERFNLEGKMDKYTYNLSKGERQKLMIIQTFFHKPDLVFIDEPLINLDPLIQERVKDLIEERKKEGGTVFLCTHVVSLAEEVCDKVYFLREGEIIEEVQETQNLKEKFLENN
ncbi:MAG: ABC transporter ATP-binding protein [Candidatus Nanohaloarchaea archaeon]